jgi:hypothetical protein
MKNTELASLNRAMVFAKCNTFTSVLFEGLAVGMALSPISSQRLIPRGISSSPMQHTNNQSHEICRHS